jgi:hypothetical protein
VAVVAVGGGQGIFVVNRVVVKSRVTYSIVVHGVVLFPGGPAQC